MYESQRNNLRGMIFWFFIPKIVKNGYFWHTLFFPRILAAWLTSPGGLNIVSWLNCGIKMIFLMKTSPNVAQILIMNANVWVSDSLRSHIKLSQNRNPRENKHSDLLTISKIGQVSGSLQSHYRLMWVSDSLQTQPKPKPKKKQTS